MRTLVRRRIDCGRFEEVGEGWRTILGVLFGWCGESGGFDVVGLAMGGREVLRLEFRGGRVPRVGRVLVP